MENKKIEWKKPVLRDLGDAKMVTLGLNDCGTGAVPASECSTGYNTLIHCIGGSGVAPCSTGSGGGGAG
jgi:hypothetical protein